MGLDDFKVNQETKVIDATKKVRVGFIGCGWIAGSHITALLKQPDVEIVAGCDLIPGKAEAKFAELEVPTGAKFFTDYKEMLSDDEIDAVYVASPHLCHAEQTVLALDFGKHVLCEKMIAADLDGFLAQKAACIRSGKVLLEAMRPDFDGSFDLIREALPQKDMFFPTERL